MLFEPFHTQLTIDPKGRLTFPASLRGALSLQGVNALVAVCNQGNRGGLSLFTLQHWRDVLTARTRDVDPFDFQAQAFLRGIAATNQTLTLDAAGRVLIPSVMRSLVGIEKEVVMFSTAGWLEVWDLRRWEEEAWPAAVDQWEEQSKQARRALPRAAEGE